MAEGALHPRSSVTLNELPDLLFFALQQQPHTDGGEVPIGHLLVPQNPLQQPFQMSLRGLQSLPTPSEISDIGGPFPERKCALQDTRHIQHTLSSETKSPNLSLKNRILHRFWFYKSACQAADNCLEDELCSHPKKQTHSSVCEEYHVLG